MQCKPLVAKYECDQNFAEVISPLVHCLLVCLIQFVTHTLIIRFVTKRLPPIAKFNAIIINIDKTFSID